MTDPQLPQPQGPGFQQPGAQPMPGAVPPPNFQSGYYPPPPKKKRTGKIILLAAAIVIALIGLTAAFSGGNDDTSADRVPGNAAPVMAQVNRQAPADTEGPELNTPVRDGKFEFVVTDVQSGVKTVGDNPYLQETAQGTYLIVSITVTNTSDSPKGFSPSNQYVFDTDDRKFGNDTMAAINLQPDTSVYEDINPGNTITAQLVFDMPEGAVADRIELHDSMFSGGVDVALR